MMVTYKHVTYAHFVTATLNYSRQFSNDVPSSCLIDRDVKLAQYKNFMASWYYYIS